MEESKRESYFDNAKFILILLVIVGHAIEPIIFRSTLLKSLYLFLYLFHMPAFILLAGYFSKNFDKENYKKKIISRTLIPYVIFSILYYTADYFFFKRSTFGISLLSPYWILWFLVSLFIWQIMLPFVLKLRYPMLFSILLAVAAGYSNEIGYYLSLSRTIVFFPFFLAGYYLQKKDFEVLQTSAKRIISLICIIIIFIAIYLLSSRINPSWLYGSYPYNQLGHPEWHAGIFRILIYFFSSLLCISFFSLVPKIKTFFTSMGSRTIYSYLLHGLLIKFLISIGLYNLIITSFDKALLIILAAITALILSTRWAALIARPLVEPNTNWLFKN